MNRIEGGQSQAALLRSGGDVTWGYERESLSTHSFGRRDVYAGMVSALPCSLPHMMNRFYLVAASLLMFAGCAVLDPDPDAVVVRPVATDTACSYSHTLSGSRLFACHCSGCHGTTGTPLVSGVPDFTLHTPEFGRFDTVLDVGPGASPRFPQLDSIARRKLYEYVVMLRK